MTILVNHIVIVKHLNRVSTQSIFIFLFREAVEFTQAKLEITEKQQKIEKMFMSEKGM